MANIYETMLMRDLMRKQAAVQQPDVEAQQYAGVAGQLVGDRQAAEEQQFLRDIQQGQQMGAAAEAVGAPAPQFETPRVQEMAELGAMHTRGAMEGAQRAAAAEQAGRRYKLEHEADLAIALQNMKGEQAQRQAQLRARLGLGGGAQWDPRKTVPWMTVETARKDFTAARQMVSRMRGGVYTEAGRAIVQGPWLAYQNALRAAGVPEASIQQEDPFKGIVAPPTTPGGPAETEFED
jgi:hypothetical protein